MLGNASGLMLWPVYFDSMPLSSPGTSLLSLNFASATTIGRGLVWLTKAREALKEVIFTRLGILHSCAQVFL